MKIQDGIIIIGSLSVAMLTIFAMIYFVLGVAYV